LRDQYEDTLDNMADDFMDRDGRETDLTRWELEQLRFIPKQYGAGEI